MGHSRWEKEAKKIQWRLQRTEQMGCGGREWGFWSKTGASNSEVNKGPWYSGYKVIEKAKKALAGLWIRVVTALLPPSAVLRACPFSWVIFFFLTFLKHRTSTCHPLLVTHAPVFIYYPFPDGKACSILSFHRGKVCFYWDKQQQNIEKDACQRGLCSYTFLKEGDRKVTIIISLRSCTSLGYILFVHLVLATVGEKDSCIKQETKTCCSA